MVTGGGVNGEDSKHGAKIFKKWGKTRSVDSDTNIHHKEPQPPKVQEFRGKGGIV